MTHGEVRAELGDYLEGDLPLARRALLDAHLDGCGDCKRRMQDLRGAVDLLRTLESPEPPPYLAERVLARIEAGEARPGALATLVDRIPWKLRARIAAPALVLASAAVLLIWLRAPEPPLVARAPAPPGLAEALSGETALGASADLEPVETTDEVLAGPRVAPADLDAALRDPAALVRATSGLPVPDRDAHLAALLQTSGSYSRTSALIQALRALDTPAATDLAARLEHLSAVPIGR